MKNKDLVTVIYYTANTEDEAFENKVRENILKVIGDLPLISVSRKPIDFGKNICIGEQPVCDSNAWKQLLIGLKEAKTKFCIAAEADCFYPPEYFSFIPPDEDHAYRYGNVWIKFKKNKNRFYRKAYSEGAQMCGRKYWIRRLEKVIAGREGWEPLPKDHHAIVFKTKDKYSWTSENPVISCKTGNGLRGNTGTIKNYKSESSLPYWGKASEINI